MTNTIHLIVGLANPGSTYQKTRHNAGAWFIESLARHNNLIFKNSAKFHGQVSTLNGDETNCHLLMPTTFMNLSGQSVGALSKFYDIAAQHILVAHDDIDLPAGTIRIKFDGGDGGHNGLKDIIQHLHTKQFYRLRIGVGRPPAISEQDVADYVLSPPSKADKEEISHALERAYDVLPEILAGNMEKAMRILHQSLPLKEG